MSVCAGMSDGLRVGEREWEEVGPVLTPSRDGSRGWKDVHVGPSVSLARPRVQDRLRRVVYPLRPGTRTHVVDNVGDVAHQDSWTSRGVSDSGPTPRKEWG